MSGKTLAAGSLPRIPAASALPLTSVQHADQLSDDLAVRVYTSRLLGAEENQVMHSGGNTSVKSEVKDFLGRAVKVLFVKRSEEDLKTIEKPSFALDLKTTGRSMDPTSSSALNSAPTGWQHVLRCIKKASNFFGTTLRMYFYPSKNSGWMRSLFLAVTNFRTHTTFLPTHFTTTFSGPFRSHLSNLL